eukprot:gb/GECH01012633.1/.p1 GENE.gb/GECH01012633.1/~~gb/GECH01012633.1/.p1  ORF type:complete len:406 (+),score=75.86 gb/GECH01012633.1/:1-1218(+)
MEETFSLFHRESPLLVLPAALGLYSFFSWKEQNEKLSEVKNILNALTSNKSSADERYDSILELQQYLLQKSPEQENVFNFIDAKGFQVLLSLINKENLPKQTQGCVKTILRIISQVCKKVQSASEFHRLEAVELAQNLGATQAVLSILYRSQTYGLKALAANTLSEITRCDTSEKVIVEDVPMVCGAARYLARSSKLDYLLDLIEDIETDPTICESVVQSIANCSHYKGFSNSISNYEAVPLLHSILTSASSAALRSSSIIAISNIVALDSQGVTELDFLLEKSELKRLVDLLGKAQDNEEKGALLVLLNSLIDRADNTKSIESLVIPFLNDSKAQSQLMATMFNENSIVRSNSICLVNHLKQSPTKGQHIASMQHRAEQSFKEEQERRKKQEMQQMVAQQMGMM